jgi:hypothetical protein
MFLSNSQELSIFQRSGCRHLISPGYAAVCRGVDFTFSYLPSACRRYLPLFRSGV